MKVAYAKLKRLSLFILLPFSFFIVSILNMYGQKESARDTLLLNEFEVVGTRDILYPIEVIDSVKIASEPIRDIGDFLRLQNNVSAIRKGGVALDPVIRGFKYSQVTVLLNNGVKVEGGCPNRMDPVASHIEMENVSKIEIVKGPYLLRYGPVFGALVNIQTIQPEEPEKPAIHGQALYGFESNWNGQREFARVYGGGGGISFNVSGGYKGYGSYTAGNDQQFSSSFRKANLNAAIGLDLGQDHKLTLGYMYDQGRDIMFPALPMDERSDNTNLISAGYQSGLLGKRFRKVSAQFYYSYVNHVMDNLDRPAARTMQATTSVIAINTGGKVEGTLEFGRARVVTGFDFEHVYKNGEKKMTMIMNMGGLITTSTKLTSIWQQARTNNIGWFAEYQRPIGKTSFILATRFDLNQANASDTFRLVKNGIDYYNELGSTFLNFSFGAGIKIPLYKQLSLSASLGRGVRSPSILERYIKLLPVQFDPYDYLGNPQLKPEKNHQADLTLEFTHKRWGRFTGGCFFSLMTDYIIGEVLPPAVIKPSTQGVSGVKQYNNIDYAHLTGFEFSWFSPAEHVWGVTVNAAATYGTNPEAIRYQVSGGQVVGQESVTNDPLPEIPPLEGSVGFYWRFFKSKLVPRINVRMVSEQNRVSAAFDEQTTPGFVTASASLVYNPCRYATFTAGVENMFNNSYYEHLNRRIIGTTERLYEPGRVFYIIFTVKF